MEGAPWNKDLLHAAVLSARQHALAYRERTESPSRTSDWQDVFLYDEDGLTPTKLG